MGFLRNRVSMSPPQPGKAGTSRQAFGMIFRCVVALAVVLLLHTTLALGQINSATLTGTVKDTSGAAVQGATMKVLQPATGAVRNSETNETGLYTVPFLQPGD